MRPDLDDLREKEKLNPSQTDYDSKFNDMMSTPDMQALGDQGGARAREKENSSRDDTAARKELAHGEKQAVGDTAAGRVAVAAAASANPVVGGAVRMLAKIKTKRGASTSALVVIIFALLVFGGGLLTTTLAPIAFMTNVIDDLNDQVAALDIRNDKMMRLKVSAAERDTSLKGCTKLSLRCKYRSLSSNQVKAFERQGIKVNVGKKVLTRTFPESYEYKNRTYDPVEFADALKTDKALRLDFKTAVNMKYLGLADNIAKRAMDRLGVSKKKPALSGSDEERMKQLADPTKLSIPDGATFSPATKEDGSPMLDANGDPMYVLDGSNPPQYLSGAEVDAYKAISVKKSFSKLSSQALKSLNILGWYDMACTFKNMLGTATIAAKLANYIKYAQYAAPIASLAYALKANEITADEAETLGKFFTDTDNRAMITDLGETIKASGSEDLGDIDTIVEKDNPDYGKNMMDSPLYKLSTYGDVPGQTEEMSTYSLGLSASGVLSAVGASANVIQYVLNLGMGDSGCQIAQSWLVRGAGFIVGIVAGIFSGGGTIALNLGIMAAISGGFIIVESILNNILSGDPFPDDIDKRPGIKSAVTWTGLSSILGEAARTRGMVPGTKASLSTYLTHQAESSSDYLAIEQQRISPFDLTSPNSLVSQVALSAYNYRPTSVSNTFTSLSSFIGSSAKNAFFGKTAAAVDFSRFEKCDDSLYEDLDIAADVQCNVRYAMYDEDLARDPYAVLDWMEDNGYIEPDSTTGFPANYTPPSPQESSNLAQSLLSGFTSSFYDNRAAYYTAASGDYAKYLDYCVYRALPWGKTFEESGALGSAEPEWKTGENCMLREKDGDLGKKVAYFRTFNMDRGLVDVTEEPSEVYADTPVASPTTPTDTTTPNYPPGTWVWPAKGPIWQKWGVWNSRRNGAHKGIDIGVPAGTQVVAAHSGTIIGGGMTYDSPACGRMLTIKIDGGETLYTNYQHLDPRDPMPSGYVKSGQPIGRVVPTSLINRGYTCSTGAHLHFQIQIHDDYIVGYSSPLSATRNPENYLP